MRVGYNNGKVINYMRNKTLKEITKERDSGVVLQNGLNYNKNMYLSSQVS
jgi:hypothetical protein